MEKVIVGMSGGVDSAVAAYLLKQQGYDVTGVTLRTWEEGDGAYSRCCDIDDARTSAFRIGIPYYPVNCVREFREQVTDRFTEDYLKGLTPNPCVVCNRSVKWEKLLHYAGVTGAKYIATGHYAYVERLENGRWTVRKALHAEKDQTYMLYRLTQEQLSRTLMPLGGLSKEEVRKIAEEAGLGVASKPDSQEICFVTSGDYGDYIERTAKVPLPGEGDFLDEDGRVLGRHKGIHRYTVGQRKGLGIAWAHPLYVKEIDPERNAVILGAESSLYTKEVPCGDLNFLSVERPAAGERLPCRAKVRYQHDAFPAVLEMRKDGTGMLVFGEPVRAAAPGQSAVFYDEEGRVIGGGVILRKAPKKAGSILIADTTREEREEIVRRALWGSCGTDCEFCSGCDVRGGGVTESIYQPYVDGLMEISEINGRYRAPFVRSGRVRTGDGVACRLLPPVRKDHVKPLGVETPRGFTWPGVSATQRKRRNFRLTRYISWYIL